MGIVSVGYFARVGGWVVCDICLFIMEKLCNLLVLFTEKWYNVIK